MYRHQWPCSLKQDQSWPSGMDGCWMWSIEEMKHRSMISILHKFWNDFTKDVFIFIVKTLGKWKKLDKIISTKTHYLHFHKHSMNIQITSLKRITTANHMLRDTHIACKMAFRQGWKVFMFPIKYPFNQLQIDICWGFILQSTERMLFPDNTK